MRAENECHDMTPDVVTSLGELNRPRHERETLQAAVTTCSTFISLCCRDQGDTKGAACGNKTLSTTRTQLVYKSNNQ